MMLEDTRRNSVICPKRSTFVAAQQLLHDLLDPVVLPEVVEINVRSSAPTEEMQADGLALGRRRCRWNPLRT